MTAPSRPFFVGANLPWVVYGCDFGANAWQPEGGVGRPERRARLDAALAQLSALGLRKVRWFVLGDGRAGLRVREDGTPELDEHFFADMDAGLQAASAHGLQVMPVLMDFSWFGAPKRVNGVQLFGRSQLVTDARRRGALLANVVRPIFERYRRHDAVWAWDAINEPEWATARGPRSRSPMTRAAMKEFIASLVDLIHRHTDHPATVGLASARGLYLVEGAGLDFYQVHWYDSLERRSPLGRPVSALALDRPVILGEFPTRGSRRSTEAILDAARRSGYEGALAWSVLAEDSASDFTRSAALLASWTPEGPGPSPTSA